jgi:putative membrane protein
MDALRNELSNYIPWFLAFHLIAVIAWMSAMLYLPRLFVYHTEAAGHGRRRTLQGDGAPPAKAIESLDDRGVDSGAAAAWLTGAYLNTWLQLKFVLVIS